MGERVVEGEGGRHNQTKIRTKKLAEQNILAILRFFQRDQKVLHSLIREVGPFFNIHAHALQLHLGLRNCIPDGRNCSNVSVCIRVGVRESAARCYGMGLCSLSWRRATNRVNEE